MADVDMFIISRHGRRAIRNQLIAKHMHCRLHVLVFCTLVYL